MSKNFKMAKDLKSKYLLNKQIPFVNELSKYGYGSIDEFLFDEAEYFLKHTEFKLVQMNAPDKQSGLVIQALENRQNTIFFVIPQRKLVWKGCNADYNEEFCKNHAIPVCFEPYNGGIICTNGTDLQIAITAYDLPGKTKEFLLDRLCGWIAKKTGQIAVVEGNDILINQKKVVGLGHKAMDNGMVLLVLQISFSVDIDFITQVCQKTMVKEPAGLQEFNPALTRSSLIQEVITWLISY